MLFINAISLCLSFSLSFFLSFFFSFLLSCFLSFLQSTALTEGPSHRGETTTRCTGWSTDREVHGQMERVPAKGGGKDRVRARRSPRGMGRVPINITYPPPLGGTYSSKYSLCVCNTNTTEDFQEIVMTIF
jgi:hypothetical protein